MSTGYSKLAIVSHTLPPERNGQAIVMERLLTALNSADYCFISTRDLPAATAGRLPVAYVQIPSKPPRLMPARLGLDALAQRINFRIYANHRADCIARVAAEQRCDAILVCTGDLFDLPGAYFAARRLGIPLIVYLFDWYACQFDVALAQGAPGQHIVDYARGMEPIVLGYADRVIVPNEFLRNELRKNYGLQAAIVRNPTDFKAATTPANAWPRAADKICVVYTGAVYEAHFDAFRNLLRSLEWLGPEWRLTVYTGQPADFLRDNGIEGPVDLLPPVRLDAVQEVQRSADILFLPLAFQSPYPDIIRTSAPGKIGDYLASGRPILVHAPEDSFVAWYFKRHECGIVVDQLNPGMLADALRRVAADAGLRARLGANAVQQASADYAVARSRAAFLSCISRPTAMPITAQEAGPEQPLVSVVIPTYNRAHLILDAIDSVLTQDYPLIELIIIDDGSTDETATTLAKYGERIRYVRQENAGAASARNHGIRLATGRYVAFLDSDDLFLPGKLRKQVECLQTHADAVLVYCHHQIITSCRTLQSDASVRYEGNVYRRLLKASSIGPMATPTIMVRREVLMHCGGFDEAMALAEDSDLWCRLARHGSFALVPEYLVNVRIAGGHLSGTAPPQTALVVWSRILDKAVLRDRSLGLVLRQQARARLLLNAWRLSKVHAAGTQWGLLARALLHWPFCWMDARTGEYLQHLPRRLLLGAIKRLVPPRAYIRARHRWRLQKRRCLDHAATILTWIKGRADKQL